VALDQDSLKVLARALKQLDAGFSPLPEFSPAVAGARRMEEVLLTLAEKLQDNYPYFHPLYAGQMLKPPHPVARLAYSLAMHINPNNHALDGGRATSALEKEAVAEIAAMFGWKEFLGHLCGGGTMANLEALWVAGQLHPGKKILASDQAHYTHGRISQVLQLPFEEVESDERGRMDMSALAKRVARGDVGTVVATMGTTATGSVDPLLEILELREKFGFRVHADAAYGGYFVLALNLAETSAKNFARIGEVNSTVIRTNMDCSRTDADACCFAIRELAGCINMIRLIPISVLRNCIWVKLVWSARGRALRPRRCGRHRNCCHWCAKGSLRTGWSAAGRRRCGFFGRSRPVESL
jgi:glutamate/tyrosine decarboxylase-like PLP-dependent enzyme